MNNLLAHAGHTVSSTDLDHCMPILIAAVIVIFLLSAVIAYMIAKWQPKSFTAAKKSSTATKKKTTKK
ncbi:MAG: hypothetical protein JWO54_883 [Candidatus Saccharibacteria bacterium]|nr:hypothetical protein [Candidatus Saccharibacteria bacterium]